MRHAAWDGMVGAVLGLLLASGLIATQLDMQQVLTDSHEPLSSLATLVSVVVLQGAIVASLCGVAVRKFSRLD
jgi:hypothetical protein